MGSAALAGALACSTAPIEGAPLPIELTTHCEALLAHLERDERPGLPQFWIFERGGAAILDEEGDSPGRFPAPSRPCDRGGATAHGRGALCRAP